MIYVHNGHIRRFEFGRFYALGFPIDLRTTRFHWFWRNQTTWVPPWHGFGGGEPRLHRLMKTNTSNTAHMAACYALRAFLHHVEKGTDKLRDDSELRSWFPITEDACQASIWFSFVYAAWRRGAVNTKMVLWRYRRAEQLCYLAFQHVDVT